MSGSGEFRWAPFGPSEREPPPSPPSEPPPPASEPVAAPVMAGTPARRIAVVTCMDARIEPLTALGLSLGDAHVIRNAGAAASDDVIRSLTVSLATGTETVIVMGHSDCLAFGGDDDQARAELLRSARRIARAVDPDGSLRVETRWYDLASGTVQPL